MHVKSSFRFCRGFQIPQKKCNFKPKVTNRTKALRKVAEAIQKKNLN